MILRVSQKY